MRDDRGLGEWSEGSGQPVLELYGDYERVVGRVAVLGRGDVLTVGAGPAGGVQPVFTSDQLPDRRRGGECGYRERRPHFSLISLDWRVTARLSVWHPRFTPAEPQAILRGGGGVEPDRLTRGAVCSVTIAQPRWGCGTR